VANRDGSAGAGARALTRWQLVLLAVTGGVSVSNLYYLQPLLAQVGQEFGARPQVTFVGWAAGLRGTLACQACFLA
jgi:hypothetical protein